MERSRTKNHPAEDSFFRHRNQAGTADDHQTNVRQCIRYRDNHHSNGIRHFGGVLQVMKRLKIISYGKRGSAPLWTFFIAILLISFSMLLYTGVALQSNYRQAQHELERAANIALDINLKNEAVRDIQLQIPLSTARTSLEHNLTHIGYVKTPAEDWERYNENRIIYRLCNLQLTQHGDQILLTGDLVLSLLWGPQASVTVPVQTSVRTLFIDLQ